MLQEALQGQTLIFNRRYSEAQAHFQKLKEKYPDSPLGSFGVMALLNAKMFENFDFTLDKEFDVEQEQNKVLVDRVAKQENSSAFDLFLCGASSGLRGFYYARQDKWMAALGESNQAKKCLERAQKKDPLFPDVDLGLGLFNYWRSVFTNRIKILPFFKDRRAEGIAQIRNAIDHGIVVGDLARAALAFVSHEQGNGRQGLPLADTLLQTYPQNIMMKNLKGNFLSLLRRTPEALAVLDEVLQTAPEINVARYYKGMAYWRAKDIPNAKAQFQEFMAHQPSSAWQAYTHYMLGRIALSEGNRSEAFEQFKKGSRVYGDYKPNLQMVLQMRREHSR
jgi:tetratricopeptide (TPR) repeat protein